MLKILWRGERRRHAIHSLGDGNFVCAGHHQRPTWPIVKRIFVVRVWRRWQIGWRITQVPRNALHARRHWSSQPPDCTTARVSNGENYRRRFLFFLGTQVAKTRQRHRRILLCRFLLGLLPFRFLVFSSSFK